MHPNSNEGLNAFLAEDPGLHSGLMMAHVTAAALVSENKVLAHPASVDTIPTSAAQEDHVSMGVHAARQAEQIVNHVEQVLAIEALAAAEAIDLRKPLKSSPALRAAHRAYRKHVSKLTGDTYLAPYVDRSVNALRSGDLERAVAKVIGPLV